MIAWEIRDASGNLVAIHERHDEPDGKRFTWTRPDGTVGLNGTPVADLPLYGSQWIEDRAVYVVLAEGERAADAIRAAGFYALATVCGAAATPARGPLEILRGRDVVLWPDADDVGRKHMTRIAALLEPIARSLRWIDPTGRPPGWDAADADADAIGQLVENARELPTLGPQAVQFPEPEDRGMATLSALGGVEYVEDLIRPGRIVLVAAEEGTGKSMTMDDELGIRLAVAGGSFAGTWAILRTDPVLVLSEMHADDDYGREAMVLAALGLDRDALRGRYFRLSLMTAAHGTPALTVPEWRRSITDWMREHGVRHLIVDTATGATQVEPWGQAILAVYAGLRAMLEAYPELAIALVLHLKKPQGRGDRRITDVLGDWGKWNDVTVLMEHDGQRTKITTRKRVRHERRIAATRRDGLLVDPIDLDEAGAGPKVPTTRFIAAITESPGIDPARLAVLFGVTERTIRNYAKAAGISIRTEEIAVKGAARRFTYFPVAAIDAETEEMRGNEALSSTVSPSQVVWGTGHEEIEETPYIEGVPLSASVPPPSEPSVIHLSMTWEEAGFPPDDEAIYGPEEKE